ncbi:membrane protein [Streptomyces olivaceoviridis]|nr:membrane protein [Streptomyces olivaceoviridis]
MARGELPDGPGSAPVYEPGAEVGRERVVRLAKALGVDGAPVAEGRIWRVGGQDGSGPRLTVDRDAPGGWSFDRYAPGTDNCRKVTVCAQDPGAPAGDPVSAAEAERTAAPVLRAAGLGGARTDASRVMGARRVVDAEPVVGGLPTYGWTTGLTVDRNGELVGGHGLLATPVKGDTYPVVGAAKTLELLNGAAGDGHRMGIGGCASPEPLKDRLEQPCGASTGAPKAAGDTVTVEKAVFGLAAHSVGGRQTLVPSWLFQVRGSTAGGAFTVTYPAVDTAYLTSASASASPAPEPSQAPGESRSVQVNAYTADGRTLNLSFYGGVCADYRTSARESGGRVTVTVTERPWPGRVCVLIAKEYVKTVTLDAPLDGRTVVGTDGKAVPRAKPGSLRPDASAQPR